MKIKALLYCTKAKPYLRSHSEYEYNEKGAIPETRKKVFTLSQNKCDYYNGKIVIECDYEVEELYCDNYCDERDGYVGYFHALPNDDFEAGEKELQKKSCLDELQINGYLKDKNGYAIHIKNLHIFDKPRDIVHYGTNVHYDDEGWTEINMLWKAPSRMMKVYDDKWNCYIFIPVTPQEMCRIANKEQTIIVRKKVLKEMM